LQKLIGKASWDHEPHLTELARQVGLGVCRDLFIHHFGTRTFAHSAPQAADLIRAASR
jgi:hypothetical protein